MSRLEFTSASTYRGALYRLNILVQTAGTFRPSAGYCLVKRPSQTVSDCERCDAGPHLTNEVTHSCDGFIVFVDWRCSSSS